MNIVRFTLEDVTTKDFDGSKFTDEQIRIFNKGDCAGSWTEEQIKKLEGGEMMRKLLCWFGWHEFKPLVSKVSKRKIGFSQCVHCQRLREE